jgi:hypothetical protein
MAKPRKYARPLNPGLYEALWEYTGGVVKISKGGQRFRYTTALEGGELTVRPVPGGGGEEYLIDCPLCGDRRQRFSINHMFGRSVLGATVLDAVHCYNENCVGLSRWLRDLLTQFGDGYAPRAAEAVAAEDGPDIDAVMRTAAEEHEKLDGVKALNRLPSDHPAVRYVEGRGFNVDYLTEYFRVGYYGGGGRYKRNQRLVAPVFYNRALVGWNARAIPGHTRLTPGNADAKWPWKEPKYVNAKGFPKSQTLYNFDLAKDGEVIGVVEGVTDVWRAGTWAMGLLGKTMSETQLRLLCAAAERRKAWIVLIGDAASARDDAETAWRKNHYALLGRYRYPERVRLRQCAGGDPGDRTAEELMQLATEAVHAEV